jgi:23S rRNA (guanine1835-N2)-methyltransferase
MPASSSTYHCEILDDSLTGLPNVFSKDSLDIGTRYLLQHLDALDPVENLIDLACGNGVLGLAACQQRLAKKFTFLDESAMAIASARLNAHRLFPTIAENFSFYQGDGLQAYQGPPVQLVLCNPPFHLDHTVDEFAGYHLLQQCAEHIAPGGRLCLVANRHLNYRPVLKSIFSRIEKLAGNSKFNVLVAHKN